MLLCKMNVRILARAIIYDPKKNKILLVKNKGAEFWYAPGGGWEHDEENILECVEREVQEEVGIRVNVESMIYAQEFQATEDTKFLELFWLTTPKEGGIYDEDHIDLDPNGQVEIAKWYSKDSLSDLKVFPKRLKSTFWDNIDFFLNKEDPFIGVS